MIFDDLGYAKSVLLLAGATKYAIWPKMSLGSSATDVAPITSIFETPLFRNLPDSGRPGGSKSLSYLGSFSLLFRF